MRNMKAPLKVVLKNFLDHVEDLEARKKLCDDQYETEFQDLKKLTDKLKEDSSYPCSIGLKDVNRPKNRYKDIVPYDFSRVILPKHEGVPGSDYINASYIKGASGAFAYIAAQGPLPNTVIDFWRMIWICDVQVVVMACNEKEAGKHKCEVYWPTPGEIKQYGNIAIELVNTSQVCPDFLVRTLLVKNGSDMRDVYQFHYTSWPDHGVPDTVQPILDLVRLMRDCQASETVPIVVHCSAGCGRTGTICAVDYVWACLRHGKLDEDFSLYQIALELRRQRIAMIQTKEQYILAHKAVAAMFEQQLKVIDCHIYENLDEDGEPLIWKEVIRGKELDTSDFMKKLDAKENLELTLTDVNKLPVESNKTSKFHVTQQDHGSSVDTVSRNSSIDNNLNMKENAVDCLNKSSRNSESSYSRNSILSQQSNEDSIPFIDEDDVCVRPNCGRAYLNMPSCDSISKLVNCFDPFVDKVSLGTDDSSPEGDPSEINNKMKDFQSISNCKTLDKNSKISAFRDNMCEKDIKKIDCKSDIVDSAKKSLFLNNRESYPPCSSSEKFQKNHEVVVADGEVNESSEDSKNMKKIGKAAVVRRPSISKLRALFEKSGVSSQKCSNEGSKRLLFRNNSHHVGRSGSAPPSLDCMDKTSAVEKESILKMVTRKFRSSSVRTEREMQSKQLNKTLNRRSATDTVKDGLNALTRTMSFTINKTFKSYSPAKMKPEISNNFPSDNLCDSVAGSYKPKSPDHPKSNSMWYDRSSLPRVVAIVKPTGKIEDPIASKPIPSRRPSDPKSPDKNKIPETHFTYITKPAKLKDFFSSLNKKDAKDPTTLWYNESDADDHFISESNNVDLVSKSDSVNSSTKSTSKVLPFLPIVPWKKVGQKSPLSSPDSPKNFNESTTPRNSTFYTSVIDTESSTVNFLTKKSSIEMPKCPVPEEIIHLNTVQNSFWPSSSVSSSTVQSASSEESDCNISVDKDNDIPKQSMNGELVEKEHNLKEKDDALKNIAKTEISESRGKINLVNDVRPAIPKKMFIGKSKHPQNNLFEKELQFSSTQPPSDEKKSKDSIEIKPLAEHDAKVDIAEEKNDLYINVNIKAKKNIEQIENTLRKTPRGAIIDLTSRESYSMEEELVNAVNQLSESSEKNKVSSDLPVEQNEKIGAKTNSKFPGYEVIWPEQSCIPIQKSTSSSKVPLINKNTETVLSNQSKTGLCYSPPLRRSVNTNRALAKSQSCGNLEWSESDDPVSNIKEQSNTPTKRLVNEAVVELNTLLNQLTTRTLSEDIDFNAKSKEKSAINKEIKNISDDKPKENNHIEPNDTVVHSVTLVTKSYNSGSSPKEEEIVFHFPPPPRGPPPKDESPIESFNIVRNGSSLVVNESCDKNANIKPLGVIEKDSMLMNNDNSNNSEKTFSKKFPQPAPRKSKQSDGLRRSSSYSNIIPPQNKNKGYENVFLEKYQTLSRLEIKPDVGEKYSLDKAGPLKKSPLVSRSQNAKLSSNYVNIIDAKCVDEHKLHKVKPEIFVDTNKFHKNKKIENVNHSVITSNNQTCNKFEMAVDDVSHGNSVYGKINRIPSKNVQATDNSEIINLVQSVGEVKRKLIHSKKSERAPLPPSMNSDQVANNERISKLSSNSSMIPKKLPSRKLEKAPPPPHLLQKSSSSINVPKTNIPGSPSYINFSPAHQIDEKSKLPAVHENVTNIIDSSQAINKNSNASSVAHSKFVNRGLSHSQSDVSVYLALKERRIQCANQERKILNMKSLLMSKESKIDPVNVSSSDSDSSYEKIFLTKIDQSEAVSKNAPKEQNEQLLVRSYKKEVPIAPPRSKRRSTTEVQYTMVKAKDASHVSPTSELHKVAELKNTKSDFSTNEDDPPAIPLKTKDAFEVPKEILPDMNKRTDEIHGRMESKPSK